MKHSSNKIALLLIGITVGLVNGFFGGGGGVIVVAMLSSIIMLSNKQSHATAIFVILPVSIASAVIYIINGHFQLLPTVYITVGVIIGGIIGAKSLSKLANKDIERIFAVVIIIAGIRMITSSFFSGLQFVTVGDKFFAFSTLYIVVSGFVSGVLGGMGMGGGMFLIPLLSFTNMTQHAVQAANLISFIPMAVPALIIHFRNKLVITDNMAFMVIPALIFSISGAFAAGFISEKILKFCFGIIIILMGFVQLYHSMKEFPKQA